MIDEAVVRIGSQAGPVIGRRVFGGFLEHVGRAVYGGIYEPGHPSANADGMRTDVLDLVRELGVTMVRYPGGNFVSAYDWEDGVGPKQDRPVRLDPAWHTLEPNQVGVGEFMAWAASAGVEPMMAVNLGTRGVADALRLLEYCNAPVGALADLRRSHGSPDPYGVTLWCLGNEMDGPWQIGRRTPAEYGRIADQTAHAMRAMDDSLQLIACGASGPEVPWFEEWTREVLRTTYHTVDQLSCHWYVSGDDSDLTSYLASGVGMDGYIEQVVALADETGAELGSDKRIGISFDEWNVWNIRRHSERDTITGMDNWPVAPPLLEEEYTLADAVVVGSLLMSLIAHAERVTGACLAQLVNAIAPIMTVTGGPAWRQTTFHPFALTAPVAGGRLLPVTVDVPDLDTTRYGAVPTVQAVACLGGEPETLHVFAVNRDPARAVDLRVEPVAAGSTLEVATLAGPDPYLTNTAAEPDRVVPVFTTQAAAEPVRLPPASWTRIRVAG